MKTIYIAYFMIEEIEIIKLLKNLNFSQNFNLIIWHAWGFVFNDLYCWRVEDYEEENEYGDIITIEYRGFTILPSLLLPSSPYAWGNCWWFNDLIGTDEDLRHLPKKEIIKKIWWEFKESMWSWFTSDPQLFIDFMKSKLEK